jgi:hypothetical protein
LVVAGVVRRLNLKNEHSKNAEVAGWKIDRQQRTAYERCARRATLVNGSNQHGPGRKSGSINLHRERRFESGG